MLFKVIENDRTRVKFAHTLARLFPLQETRRPKAKKRLEASSIIMESHGTLSPCKRKKTCESRQSCLPNHDHIGVKQEPKAYDYEDVVAVVSRQLYPTVPPHPVCGICIGNERFSYERRMKRWERKDVLNKHVDTHFRDPAYQGDFICRYPGCFSKLLGIMHFKRHSLDVHQVAH